MIVTEVLPSRLLCIPVCVFFILKIILYTLFATELKQESIHLFGVFFGFTAVSLVFTIFNLFTVRETKGLTKADAIEKYVLEPEEANESETEYDERDKNANSNSVYTGIT